MALYIGDKKYAVTKALYRGFYMVVVHGFAGTTVTCAGTTLYIGSNESVIFKIIDPGTYTFIATRKGETKTETLVLDPETSQYSYNIGMYIGIQKIEYLQGSNTQYIDTGVFPKGSHTKVVVETLASMNDDQNGKTIFGSRDSYGVNAFCCSFFNGQNERNLRCQYGSNTSYNINASLSMLNKKVTYVLDKNVFTVYDENGTAIGTYSGALEDFTGASSMFLFGWNNTNSGSLDGELRNSGLRIYSCKIYEDNELIHDFIPVLDNTQTGCMYDKVTQEIYYNAGEGEFITGPSMAYDELVYIESDGNQWIDTGWIATNGMIVDACVKQVDGELRVGSITLSSQTSADLTRNNISFNTTQDSYSFSKLANYSNYYQKPSDDRPVTIHFDTTGTNFYASVDNNVVVNTTSGTFAHQVNTVKISYSDYEPKVQKGRYYYVQIRDENGTLIRDLIPVKRKTGEVCMWDKVEEKFYYNKGTDNFIAGPVKSYTELEYLESTGTQYIDTGVIGNLNTKYEITVQASSAGKSLAVFGSRTSATENTIMTTRNWQNSTNQIINDFGDYQETRQIENLSTGLEKITFVNDKNSRSFYNWSTQQTTTTTTTYSTAFTTPTTLRIGQADVLGGLANVYNFEGKIFGCKIWNNDTLVRDLVPVRRSDNVLGLLDKVNDKFYRNCGTGSFIAGPSLDYTELQWIEGTGTQFINTEIQRLLENDYKIESGITYSDISTRQLNGVGGYTYFGVVNGYYQVSRQGTDHQNIPAISNTMSTFELDFDCPNNKMRYSINGGTQTEENVSYINNPENGDFYLFGIGPTSYLSNQKLHYFKLYRNNVLVRDFIPVKTDTDEVCLFDKVTHRYFHNIGTGNFIAGPIKSN